ncbi:hypothetical protein [Clostridium sp. Marseille-P2415]|uniref:hypothetical protein n=1 Tax=Clostridium sp. Marseille-P2415 TaxID=1805471 RepID=UPI00098868EA|nr:hypothetical protein [Clostridium sp. Marseille-P2415]
MSRSYHVYALSDRLKARKIEREIAKVDGVKDIRISEDLREMSIEMDTGKTSAIMERVVNICNRISNGCEVKYKFS